MTPKRDKLYDVTYQKETRRVAGHAAHDAVSLAFPRAHFTEVDVQYVGTAVDAAIEAQVARERATTVRPPPPDLDDLPERLVRAKKETAHLKKVNATNHGAYLQLLDQLYLARQERKRLRQQLLAARVAARLGRIYWTCADMWSVQEQIEIRSCIDDLVSF